MENLFRQQTDLPGVMIKEGEEIIAVISRRRAMEILSQAYGREIFLRRPISAMLNTHTPPPLVMPDELDIAEAVRQAMCRPPDYLYEPFLVQSPSKQMRLVDFPAAILRLCEYLEIKNEENSKLVANLKQQSEIMAATLENLRQTQRDLVQAEKLAGLSRMVAGMAHEINTPVGTAFTAMTYLQEQSGVFLAAMRSGNLRRSELEKFVNAVVQTCSLMHTNLEHAARLIQSFKQVAIDQVGQVRRRFRLLPYLNQIVDSLQPRLRRFGHKIHIVCPENMQMESYPGAIAQVITNLVMNSLQHAFADGERGEMHIVVSAIPPDQVRIDYCDNGRGIPAEHRSRIFEPFFTTRREEGGSGLGLSIVHNLVTGLLHGTISLCDDHAGRGAAFVISIPRLTPHLEIKSTEQNLPREGERHEQHARCA